jgi:hypothetical protein
MIFTSTHHGSSVLIMDHQYSSWIISIHHGSSVFIMDHQYSSWIISIHHGSSVFISIHHATCPVISELGRSKLNVGYCRNVGRLDQFLLLYHKFEAHHSQEVMSRAFLLYITFKATNAARNGLVGSARDAWLQYFRESGYSPPLPLSPPLPAP